MDFAAHQARNLFPALLGQGLRNIGADLDDHRPLGEADGRRGLDRGGLDRSRLDGRRLDGRRLGDGAGLGPEGLFGRGGGGVELGRRLGGRFGRARQNGLVLDRFGGRSDGSRWGRGLRRSLRGRGRRGGGQLDLGLRRGLDRQAWRGGGGAVQRLFRRGRKIGSGAGGRWRAHRIAGLFGRRRGLDIGDRFAHRTRRLVLAAHAAAIEQEARHHHRRQDQAGRDQEDRQGALVTRNPRVERQGGVRLWRIGAAFVVAHLYSPPPRKPDASGAGQKDRSQRGHAGARIESLQFNEGRALRETRLSPARRFLGLKPPWPAP